MAATISPDFASFAGLLSLPSELRPHIYSYLGPIPPRAIEIYKECTWMAKADPKAKTIASLDRTCKTVHQEITGLFEEMREAIVTIRPRPMDYDTSYHGNPTFERQHDISLDWLLRMRSVTVFPWIDLDQCPGVDEDIEQQNLKEIRMATTDCED